MSEHDAFHQAWNRVERERDTPTPQPAEAVAAREAEIRAYWADLSKYPAELLSNRERQALDLLAILDHERALTRDHARCEALSAALDEILELLVYTSVSTVVVDRAHDIAAKARAALAPTVACERRVLHPPTGTPRRLRRV